MFALLISVLLAAPHVSPEAAINDARLNGIYFVDAQCGWAVGDRGAIWHTNDGGAHWQRQESGVGDSLRSVVFQNARLGWAVGGFTHPYTHAGTGIVLSTRDGGKTWTHHPKLSLPALRHVGFFDPLHGWAAGCRSAMYPSGTFVTSDGGQSWRPLPGGRGAGVVAADLLDLRTGVVADSNRSLAIVHAGEIEPVQDDRLDLRRIARIRLAHPAHGWLVGEGGLVRTTTTLGSSWQSPPRELPNASRHFDFAALAVRGTKCWIAGAPGTRVFFTADAGRNWSSFETGTPLPLHTLAFVDDQHGWAAGELGTILATSDGGKTWRPQRGGNRRAALLGIVVDPEDAPLELLARFGGNEGYRAVVDVVGRRDIEVLPREDVPLVDRIHEAVVQVGGCAASNAWAFPLRQEGLTLSAPKILDIWNNIHEGYGAEELQARIVRQIRLWRPDIVVAPDLGREEKDPVFGLVHRAVLRAVAQAADEGAFPAQIIEAGLKTWRVRRVYAAMPPGARGTLELTGAQLLPALGCSLAEAVADPRGLLRPYQANPPPTISFRRLDDQASAESDSGQLFGGIAIPPGSEARRETAPPAADRADSLQQNAKKCRNVQAILDRARRSGQASRQLLAQLDELTRDLNQESAGRIYDQLAVLYHHAGEWSAAAETYRELANRYPDHALAPSARLWLIRYYASGEASHFERLDAAGKHARYERAVALGKELERTRFNDFFEPSARFPLAAAYRKLGQTRQAERLYQIQTRSEVDEAWWACSRGELRLDEAGSPSTKPTLACLRAAARPHLDGLLDEPLWKQAKRALLKSAEHDDREWPASVMLAYDNEFLYLGIQCRTPPGIRPSPSAGAGEAASAIRSRDADLSAWDRVELLLDIDRDFSTYYRLVVDCRGWTHEDCWDAPAWNPAWYVAANQGSEGWTVEAAIALKDLLGDSPQARNFWAIGIQRIVPGVGFQSWSTPAAVVAQPNGFGYLVFE